jgi:O-methyltransferase involved in polyketide biosynthesis
VNADREARQSVLALKGAAESLLVTLSSRAFESKQASPILRDEKAVQLLASLEYDAAPLAQSRLYHTIICLRTRRFDAAVSEFLQLHPDGVVVNLGCGLDTRFERVDNGRAHWIEVDFPEVIEIRRKLLSDGVRRQFIPCSITDLSWISAVEELRDRPIFFFAEGVFMFLEALDAERVIVEVAMRFPGSTLLFDAVKPIEVTLRRFHPTLRRTQSKLRWGLSGGRAIEALHPSLRLVAQWFYCEEAEPRLGWYRLLRFVPWFGRTAWILRCQVDKRQSSASDPR